MSIVDLAENDLALTLESTSDFGQVYNLTNPAGDVQPDLSGQFSSISQFIDPDTGVEVSGDFIQVTGRISSITIGVPVGIEDSSSTPWLITRLTEVFKIFKTLPDKKLGIVTMVLEPYKVTP